HRVDTVVVYKVDRLTRSLMDFAKIVELFDRHGVTFVAVTQQFNTTTSMGRLTLNILLSFAQFEREVIGERVRDKIAASKKKGMWMGGVALPRYRFDEAGHRLTPSYATKAGRRYRYYVSRPLVTGTAAQAPDAWRVPASQLEALIATEAAAMLAEPGAIASVLERAGLQPEQLPAALANAERLRSDLGRDATRGNALATIVERIELSPIRL